jgi:BASS family bile acid:Na+ symporter
VKSLLLTILKIGLPLSVAVSVFARGLTIVPGQLAVFRERPWLMFRSLVALLVLVRVAVLAIVYLLRPSNDVAIGLAILAACPAAPMMLVKVPKKGGSLPYMASLHLSLALLAVVTVPVTLASLSRALGFPPGLTSQREPAPQKPAVRARSLRLG